MTPHDLGFPETFAQFRPAQDECFEHCLTSEKRIMAIGAPPGVGKSGIAVGLGKLWGGRTVILTGTLGLQDQYHRVFGPMLTDMRGRSNFQCWEGGSCEDGRRMDCKEKDSCPYLVQHRRFLGSDICITSYAWWLAGKDTGPVDTLILDEAGLAAEWLSRSLDFRIYEREAQAFGGAVPGESMNEWIKLAPRLQDLADRNYADAKCIPERYRRAEKLREAEDFVERTAKLNGIDEDNWTIERVDGTNLGRVWKFECVWPGRYREKLLHGIGRVVLLSATLRPKTFGLLGMKHEDVDFREWPRQFPAANGPVVWVPTARMNHRISEENYGRWLERLREICAWGSDRNGLIHTVSYARAKQISQALCQSDGQQILLNGAADPDTSSARSVYERFLRVSIPSVLVSPSFSTGWDFPRQSAEWQVIAKIAFPDTRSKVMQARCDSDRDYPNYIAAQELVQGCGRIVRSEEDLGTTLIIDDSWAWFQRLAADHLPKWFKVRREERLPKPLVKL